MCIRDRPWIPDLCFILYHLRLQYLEFRLFYRPWKWSGIRHYLISQDTGIPERRGYAPANIPGPGRRLAGGGGGRNHGALRVSHLLYGTEKEIWIFVTCEERAVG